MLIIQLDTVELSSLISDAVSLALKNQQYPTERKEKLSTRKEVSERFHISLPTLNTYTKNGKIKGYRIGRRVLYKAAEIEAALTSIKTKGRADVPC